MHWINTYTATVLVKTRSLNAVEQALAKMANSGGKHVSHGSVSAERSSRGWVEIEFSFEARSLSHACTMASSLARAASGAEPIACHVIAKAEQEELVAGPRSVDTQQLVEEFSGFRMPEQRSYA